MSTAATAVLLIGFDPRRIPGVDAEMAEMVELAIEMGEAALRDARCETTYCLVALIALVNLCNRINVIARRPAGRGLLATVVLAIVVGSLHRSHSSMHEEARKRPGQRDVGCPLARLRKSSEREVWPSATGVAHRGRKEGQQSSPVRRVIG